MHISHTVRNLEITVKFESSKISEARDDISLSLELLKDVLSAIYRFDIDGLEGALSYLRKLNPSTKDYLSEALRKLSPYYEVALNLTNPARSTRYPLSTVSTVSRSPR